jgi:hypothetical protein
LNINWVNKGIVEIMKRQRRRIMGAQEGERCGERYEEGVLMSA